MSSRFDEGKNGARHSTKNASEGNHGRAVNPVALPSQKGTRRAPSHASAYTQPSAPYTQPPKKRMSRGKKIAIGVVSAVIVLLVGVGTAAALYINSINDSLSFDDEFERQELNDALAPVANDSDPFYVMLLGSDARGDEASRSDVNILVRVDPLSGQLTMVSIPRDTKVEIEGYGTQKINAAYAFGGAPLAVKTMSDFSGVPLSHYAEIHFTELITLVDTLHGVEVDVPVSIDDPDAGGSLSAGLQTINGEQALIFARSRAFPDGDFQRTANQRILLQAIVDKVLSLPPTELPGAIQALAQCVKTDYSVSDIVSLAQKFKAADALTIYSGMVPSSTATIDGVSYVITDDAAWMEMMRVIDAGEDPTALVKAAVEAEISSASEAA